MSEHRKWPWKVLQEVGLTFETAKEIARLPALSWPVSAEVIGADDLFIVDELGVHDGVPFSMQCRTLILSSKSEIVYDSSIAGIYDGYGCKMDDAHFAILRRTRWDICIFRVTGELVFRIDLTRITKRFPRLLSYTPHGTFLLACLTKSHEIDMVEVGRDGRAIWYLPRNQTSVGVPGSMQLLDNGNILIADQFRHVVQEVRRDGSTLVRWGVWAEPSSRVGYLSGPRAARQLNDGTLLIADGHNHRSVRVDVNGSATDIVANGHNFVCPTYVRDSVDGGYIVCDGGNGCVWSIDRAGDARLQAGVPTVREVKLSFPRSVQYLGANRYLIADTAHNRVVTCEGDSYKNWATTDGMSLFWPRAARMTVAGNVVIADGRNSRIVEISPDGELVHELKEIRASDRSWRLQDPHDVRPLAKNHLLVADSSANLVFEVDWDGVVSWMVGEGPETLNDPHSAQIVPDGRVVIADTGNHRILFVDPVTCRTSEIGMVYDKGSCYRLHFPRYAEVSDDGTLAIADSANNRILVCDLDGSLKSEISLVDNTPIASMQFPRWVQILNAAELVATDHFHHRVLHLRNTQDD
jgi:hypothetical protein